MDDKANTHVSPVDDRAQSTQCVRIFLTFLVSSTGFQGHWQKDSVQPSPHEHSGDLPHEHPHNDNRSVTAKPTHMDSGTDLSSPEVREFYNIPPTMDSEEASYLLRTILSFKCYKRNAFAMNHVRMQNFYALPESHRTLRVTLIPDSCIHAATVALTRCMACVAKGRVRHPASSLTPAQDIAPLHYCVRRRCFAAHTLTAFQIRFENVILFQRASPNSLRNFI